jgi:hypothetical protein
MRIAELIETRFRVLFIGSVVGAVALTGIAYAVFGGSYAFWPWIVLGPIVLLGVMDLTQKKQAIRRNFPVLGRMRYLLELVRPEIYQYFVESDKEGVPFDREHRSLIYQRAKNARDTTPFGTKIDVYAPGYEWVNHSLQAKEISATNMRVTVGGPDCRQPYSCSLLNVSAMSFGSLSMNAILAFSRGAKLGRFAHNTGEGGLSPYHLQGGGDLIWQIGTGYFSCRDEHGNFSPAKFAERSVHPNVKMIEIKLSQGAKPGHGGILPAAKVTAEIAEIRGVPMGKDVLSPPTHSAFSTPIGLLQFVKQLRDLSGGKPVGFKLCVGRRREFLAICKAMVQTGITPDFITVDGGEGGTGAAPLERGADLRPQRARRVFVAEQDQDPGQRQSGIGLRHAEASGDRGRRHHECPGHDDGHRLHPGVEVQQQSLPGRSRDSGQAPDGRAGPDRQIGSGGELSKANDSQSRRNAGSTRPRFRSRAAPVALDAPPLRV